MELDFITDPELAPRPRGEVRITGMTLTPYPDGRRVRAEIDITPFAPVDRPSLEIMVTNADGLEVSSTSVIEAMHHKLRLTIHLGEPEPAGRYTFRAELYYDPEQIQHTANKTFTLTPGASDEE